MKDSLKKEIEKIAVDNEIFQQKNETWEDFLNRFEEEINWRYISEYKKLSEEFMDKHSDKVNWYYISQYQKLSEEFIEKHSDKVNWYYTSRCQRLSEEFIEKHSDKVNWGYISKYQILSEEFIKKHLDKINVEIQKKSHRDNRTFEEKILEIKDYAKRYNLEMDDKYLYAYRNHDQHGCGVFNKTIFYEKGEYYRDWHCDLDSNNENSFGYGIWPEGNTKVRIKFEDWGVSVNREDGKGRVWGFEII
jgi:hypothetical protein